jgi:transcriptional antiterminator NusG
MTHKWYIAQAYSGYEKKVAASIMEKVKLKDLDDSFDKIVVPTEEVVEVKKGKKRNAERKFFPGYILIKMIMNDDTYHLLNGLPKFSCFLGHVQGKPTPFPEA